MHYYCNIQLINSKIRAKVYLSLEFLVTNLEFIRQLVIHILDEISLITSPFLAHFSVFLIQRRIVMSRAKQATKSGQKDSKMSFKEFQKEVLADYKLACESREASLLGRKEVLTGKAKFGIFGDGKEVAQIALAKSFKNGDFRSGYYRDQTFIFATGMGTIEQFFAQLYANVDIEAEPHSGGRQMNAHFATRSLNGDGSWKDLTKMNNTAADSSPTASQMARGVGLAYASKLYREVKELKNHKGFSNKGNEVTFCTIGDASTSEGPFWETLNAIGVLKAPMAVSIWDDGYGISVPQKYQTTKSNLSEIVSGFAVNEKGEGYDIYTAKGWDYPALCEMYAKGVEKIRDTHIPAIFHITDVTQPQGHSTSGSHERYKSKERLQWEIDFDCIKKMREWMTSSAIATDKELAKIESDAKNHVRDCQKKALKELQDQIKSLFSELDSLYSELAKTSQHREFIEKEQKDLKALMDPLRKDAIKSVRKILRITRKESSEERTQLINWKNGVLEQAKSFYNTYLFSESAESATNISPIAPEYDDSSKTVNGFEILNACFDEAFKKHNHVFAFGEDVGKIGDVNQGFAGLQDKYGELRITDTGIRENTIIGQGIGMAMRGLRPIAEIQYLDYLIYGLQPIADDLATLQYRTKGGQKAPLIIRTRGHRLEGIWHTGSPIGMIINSVRGVHVLTPRNMTQAAGFYNTMLQSDEPAIIIECLNGYRLKEQLPNNIGEFRVPLGVPEVLQEGTDITIVTYGSCVRIAQEAIDQLEEVGISVELIDVQTLLPFDINHSIVESLAKTNKVLFLDEDVPGGASAYMMQQVLEIQNGYEQLDAKPATLAAHPHRSPYGSDGDYFSKPNAEDVFEAIYTMMHESDPEGFPEIE